MTAAQVLTYEGCNFFRQRLVLATLSSRPIRIIRIRQDSDEPGIKGTRGVIRLWAQGIYVISIMISMLGAEYEAGFIRLLDTLTNGSRIEVNETGSREEKINYMLDRRGEGGGLVY